uniref:X-prolyl aminopeptidase 2 n=1 Tax=Otus sunia TaxID=257818 RepID=A0A8C8ASQ2_9STRI
LWTDSRYWTQAERQLDCNWELQRTSQWGAVPVGGNISLDPFLFSIDTWNSYRQALHGSGRTLLPIENNLVDQVWGDQRPPPLGVGGQLRGTGSVSFLAGLFNLRGHDIPYNPVFYSYTLLTNTSIRWAASLCGQGAWTGLSTHPPSFPGPAPTGPSPGPAAPPSPSPPHPAVPSPIEKLLEDSYSPVMLAKAVKNPKEQELLRAAHVRDAVAVIQYLLWLEKMVPQGQVDEFSGAQHIDTLRQSVLFQSISASGLNAALAHYSPSNGSSRKLSVDEMYLSDTGGQYLDGTTDITRTVHWGVPTPLQKVPAPPMPANTPLMVESFARRALWDVGLNYGHGTGHGIGNFLSVHECRCCGTRTSGPMVLPGYYRDGEFGIRIEDVALVVNAQTEVAQWGWAGRGGTALRGLHQARPGDTPQVGLEIRYLNTYYETIRARVGPELQRQRLDEEYRWLQRNTEPFPLGSAATTTTATTILGTLTSLLPTLFTGLQA